MTNVRTAAIWWRISTDDQKEISPDTQVNEGMALAQRESYQVPDEYVLGGDWHSLSVWESPPMERLKELIRSHAIQAVFMYDPDRSPSKPAHRLLFRALCEENGVKIRACHGQVPDGDMGEVMEFLSAWAKEKQVQRAQRGSRDGMRDRVRLKRLPAATKPPYGYRWDGSHFVPDDRYPVLQGIWRMLLEAKTDRGIAGVLTRAGVPAPGGGPIWHPRTIGDIATNPAYCGRYTALRSEVAEPRVRKKDTYGKSSRRWRRPEEHVLLEGLVERPVVAVEEFEAVQQRRKENKDFGGRRTHTYLLAGMVFCSECGGRYSGVTLPNRRLSHVYRCGGSSGPVGRTPCRARRLRGSEAEQAIWQATKDFLENPELFLTRVDDQQERQHRAADQINDTVSDLEHQLERYASYRQRAYDGLVRGETDEETYRRVVAGYQAHESWLKEELVRQRRDLEVVERKALRADTVRQMYQALRERLAQASDQDRRFVLECLGTRVMVQPEGLTVELEVPDSVASTVRSSPYPA